MKYIVCIGGSGQIVLHYYLQLYLLGVVADPFRAIVIDTDEIIPSIEVVKNFFKELQYGDQREEIFGGTIPIIEVIRVTPQQGETALEVLGGVKNWEKIDPHLTQAFFSMDTLRQNLMQGLFARPVLSSVISEEFLKLQALTLKSDFVAVVVGSVIGGTGGGLVAPVIEALKKKAQASKVKSIVKAVILGEYFSADPAIIEGGQFRFQSNQLLVLLTIKEALEELNRFYFVGGPGTRLIDRHPTKEKEAKNLSWPVDGGDPLWEGVRALDYLLTETAMDTSTKRFQEREVEKLKPNEPFSFSKAEQRLSQALHIVNRIERKKVIVRLAKEPWAVEVWGKRLTDLIIHFWGIAAQMEGGKERVKDFPHQVQDVLERLWLGYGDQRGLESLFSSPEKVQKAMVTPGDIRRIPWPEPKGAWDRKQFQGTKATAQKTAATLLFWALRKGV